MSPAGVVSSRIHGLVAFYPCQVADCHLGAVIPFSVVLGTVCVVGISNTSQVGMAHALLASYHDPYQAFAIYRSEAECRAVAGHPGDHLHYHLDLDHLALHQM